MIDLLQKKWDKLKEEIESLKPFALESDTVRMKIRQKKNEASVLRFGMESIRLRGADSETVLQQMQDDRDFYKQSWGY